MFSPEWFAALSGILLMDLILSGDNAIMIALASKNLPEHHRGRVIVIGGVGAVLIRVGCTLFATGMLAVPYLTFIGGIALLFIAVHLLAEDKAEDGREKKPHAPTKFWAAVRTILIADFIMSLDNILSLAGIANTVPEGKWSLIICGLMISIPIVLCGAQLFLMIMLRVPVVIDIGAAVLGYTAAELMLGDQAMGAYLEPYALPIKVLFVLGVLILGNYLQKRAKQRAAAEHAGTRQD